MSVLSYIINFTCFCDFASLLAAPELLNREPYSYSVDVWSFGVMLFELLHGRVWWWTRRVTHFSIYVFELMAASVSEPLVYMLELVIAFPRISERLPYHVTP